MKRRLGVAIVGLLLVAVLLCTSEPTYLAHGQTGEPRFSYPGARRFAITSYFDHHAPDYTVDHNLTIYTTEVGLDTHGPADCYWAGTIQVCGYYTQPDSGGRRIYYDGHPGIDYAFPLNTPVTAAASGIAHRRTIGTIQVVGIDHGNDYWTKYLHVDDASRIADNSPVERGQQVALSSNTGPQPMAAHLHFEGHYSGENGPVFDPYGWWGYWYTDPWNQPFGHTVSWWRSGDPIPMGYRNQNNAAQGPIRSAASCKINGNLLTGYLARLSAIAVVTTAPAITAIASSSSAAICVGITSTMSHCITLTPRRLSAKSSTSPRPIGTRPYLFVTPAAQLPKSVLSSWQVAALSIHAPICHWLVAQRGL
jgi:hypothetical protein